MTSATERIRDVTMLAIDLNEQHDLTPYDRSRTLLIARIMQPGLVEIAADYEARQRAAWLDRLCATGQFERLTP